MINNTHANCSDTCENRWGTNCAEHWIEEITIAPSHRELTKAIGKSNFRIVEEGQINGFTLSVGHWLLIEVEGTNERFLYNASHYDNPRRLISSLRRG